MKSFFKIFSIFFICFTLILTGVVIAILKMPEKVPENTIEPSNLNDPNDEEKPKVVEKSELQKLVEGSNRVNVVLLGLEGPRTDVIILASFDPKNKKLDMISIPRDTFYHIKGYDRADEKKINAIYGRSKSKGGRAEGVMKAVANILKVPIHYYVTLSYEGVEDIIDSLGGVEVNIPFDMYYDDPYSKPPLHIHFKKGTKVLNGKEGVKFLRFRKNNDNTHSDGDIGRISRQQHFIKAAAKKALSFKLPVVAHTTFKLVKTSMELDDVIYYSKSAIGISTNDIKTHKLPGKARGKATSYYFHDEEAVEELMINIYKKVKD